MALEQYIYAEGKKMRCGYTTGTCAALACAAAVRLLLTGEAPAEERIVTPSDTAVEAEILQACCSDSILPASGFDRILNAKSASCAVAKDAGDDVDITRGALIVARVWKTLDSGVRIDGGQGVGRVTRPGLDQPVGEAAINHVPRQMIHDEALAVCEECGYQGGLYVEISVPRGRELAEKTFNPELGIEGGISILGTSGIVEPMSVQALVDTIALELKQSAAMGHRHVILTPGNYGMDFIRDEGLAPNDVPVIKCSNYIGDAIDLAVSEAFRSILLVGHAGKLVKVAGGIMNTHSRTADCRRELFCAHAAVCGAGTEVCRQLMEAATSDACIEILDGAGIREPVMASLTQAVEDHLQKRAADSCRVGTVIFSGKYGILGVSSQVNEIKNMWTE